jgi:hypothetical protein
MLRSLRRLVDYMEDLRDLVGLNTHHQDSAENSEGLAIGCAQGDVRAGDPQLPHDVKASTHDCTFCVFLTFCT